jgi:hypothetical protein
MVYEGLYSGTWFGPGHGGLLAGAIVKGGAKPEEKTADKAEKPVKKAGETGS